MRGHYVGCPVVRAPRTGAVHRGQHVPAFDPSAGTRSRDLRQVDTALTGKRAELIETLSAAPERAEPEPVVDECLGNQLAQRRIARRADRPTMLS